MTKNFLLLFASLFLISCVSESSSPNISSFSAHLDPSANPAPGVPAVIDDEVTIYPRDMCALLEKSPYASASYYLYHSGDYPCVEFPKEACKNTDFDSLLPGDRFQVEVTSETNVRGPGVKDTYPAQ